MTAPKPNTTNSGITASEAVVEITMESLEASNHPEAKAILALIASKVREARIDELRLAERNNQLRNQDGLPRFILPEEYINYRIKALQSKEGRNGK